MSAALTVADVLDRAADLIEPEGAWIGGASEGGCHCTWTAILAAAGGSAGDADANVSGVLTFAKFVGAKSAAGIWRWNDAPERTQPEVVAKLREAAAIARGEVA